MDTKRGDMPATGNNLDPQSAGYMSEFKGTVKVDDLGRWNSGITIREQFAMAMAQGFVSTSSTYDLDKETIAIMAVEQADAVLAELERTK